MQMGLRRVELVVQTGTQTIQLPVGAGIIDIKYHLNRLWLFAIAEIPVTEWADFEVFIIDDQGDFPEDKFPIDLGEVYTGSKIYHVFQLRDWHEEEEENQ